MSEERRPLRAFVRAGNKVLNIAVFLLVLLLISYSAYSVWYTKALTSGAFLSDEIAMYKPTGVDPTLEDLAAVNPDVRGWLTIDDTHIDYPLVQGKDDSEYLNKNVMGEFSLAGAIFLESRNASDFTDPYNIVYGHHISGGAMFSDVLEFRTASFFQSHPSGTLWTAQEKAYRIEVFACIEVDALDYVIYQDPHAIRAEMLPEVAADIISRSTQKRNIEILEDDHVIAMSTCEDAESFDRVVLFGKLIPMSEEGIAAAKARNLKLQEEAAESPEELPWYARLTEHPIIQLSSGALAVLLLLLLLARQRNRG